MNRNMAGSRDTARTKFVDGHEMQGTLPPVMPAAVTAVLVVTSTAATAKAVSASTTATTAATVSAYTEQHEKHHQREEANLLTSASTASTIHRHLLKLWRYDGLGLTQDADEFASRFGVIGGEVGVRGTLHSSTLHNRS